MSQIQALNPLTKFSTAELIEELARRQNEQPQIKPKQWCHDCKHFVAWDDQDRNGSMPPDFNPCTKGRQMKFAEPLNFDGPFGFYLTVCADRDSFVSPTNDSEDAQQ